MVSAAFEEPGIPALSPRAKRILLAGWISLGAHAALIALVQVAPPAAVSLGEQAIEARLVSNPVAPRAVKVPPLMTEVTVADASERTVPLLAPSVTAEAVADDPIAPPPLQAAPSIPPQPAQDAAPATVPAPAAVFTSSVDLTYYSVRDLDVHPGALHEIVPEYPAEAVRQRQSGKVVLQLKLEADGRVSDIEVVSANPPDIFNESALKAFRNERFTPAQKNGRPVRARVLIPIMFEYDGDGQPRH